LEEDAEMTVAELVVKAAAQYEGPDARLWCSDDAKDGRPFTPGQRLFPQHWNDGTPMACVSFFVVDPKAPNDGGYAESVCSSASEQCITRKVFEAFAKFRLDKYGSSEKRGTIQ
jgi:hypothetical protein